MTPPRRPASAPPAARGSRPPSGGAFWGPKRTPRQAANAELHLALLKVANQLSDELAAVLKPADLSLSQYNVLRILRGSGAEGATCGQVIDRMLQRDPDVTRLIDRLGRRGLIERHRDARDRRVVRTCLTYAGLDLLASLDDPVNELHHRHLGHLSDRQLGELRGFVESLRK